ncbi:MAG: EamA family transporter [bacterium]|nr:EamA family transporter [bacterium]
MLVARRSTEKHVATDVSSLGMAWIQQAIALPFIIFTLFFARFYWPSELSTSFWMTMTLYVILISIDIFCYFKALSLADVSFIAPIMTLVAISNIVGAYFVLGQVPTIFGFMGAVLIVLGAAITYKAKKRDEANKHTNKLALLFVLTLVAVRGFNSNIEVSMLRESNPTTFNFYSSLLTVPFILATSIIIIATNRNGKYKGYWTKLSGQMSQYKLLLLFIGLTYTVNMLATYQAKLIGPNAGYVGAIKAASVLPMMLVGVFFFKEKIVNKQWAGLILILSGLVLLALN